MYFKFNFREKYMKKNDIVRTLITDMSFDGMGIGRDENGFVIFVQNAVVGETVDAHILKVLKNTAYAKIHKIITPSEMRIEPECPLCSKCGGCAYQHISYEKELEIKTAQINNVLKNIAKTDVRAKNTLPSPSVHRYRNKALFPLGYDENEKITAGFYKKRSHTVIPCDDCIITPESFIKIKDCIIDFMEKYGLKPYDEETHKGLVRHIFLRKAYHTDEIMVGLVINADTIPHKEEFTDTLLSLDLNVKSIVLNINKKKTNVILGKKTVAIYGVNYIHDTMNENHFEISCQSFYQVNTPQAEKLYETALSFIDEGNDTVFDLYCGIGTISHCLSKKAKKVYGIESCAPAVEDANRNKKLNRADNLEFICDLAENAVPKLIKSGITPDIVVLDPPRSGCEKSLIDTILKAEPKKIIYISCNPATLARDINLFKEKYNLEFVQGVDLFPKTNHVETVALMVRTVSGI